MNNKFDVIVIGAGAAGLTAALYAARNNYSVMLIENKTVGGQLLYSSNIVNFPGHKAVDGTELAIKMHEQAEEQNVFTLYEDIESVNLKTKTIKTAGNTYTGKSIIIACGAARKKLGIKGEEDWIGNGIYYNLMIDTENFAEQNVIVVGGGDSAAQSALYLAPKCKQVVVVNNAAELKSKKVLQTNMSAIKNITILNNTSVAKLITKRNLVLKKRLEGVELSSGETINSSHIFVAVGNVANTALFKNQIELSDKGYIKVAADMQTSVQGVFACGDITERTHKQIITACADGAVASAAATEYLENLKKN